ncbi:SCO4225 family membrane protein [Streptomyces sp. NPDC054956]
MQIERNNKGSTMERRWSKPEMWIPAGYLAVVLGLLVWATLVIVTGGSGLALVGPTLATAPVSLLLMVPFGPGVPEAPDPALDPTSNDPAYYGAEPPRPELPREAYPAPGDPLPADWVPDTSVAAQPDLWAGFGLYASIVIGALVNAALLWMVVRAVARRRRPSTGTQGTYGGLSPA